MSVAVAGWRASRGGLSEYLDFGSHSTFHSSALGFSQLMRRVLSATQRIVKLDGVSCHVTTQMHQSKQNLNNTWKLSPSRIPVVVRHCHMEVKLPILSRKSNTNQLLLG